MPWKWIAVNIPGSVAEYPSGKQLLSLNDLKCGYALGWNIVTWASPQPIAESLNLPYSHENCHEGDVHNDTFVSVQESPQQKGCI